MRAQQDGHKRRPVAIISEDVIRNPGKGIQAAASVALWLFHWRHRLATIAVGLLALVLGVRLISGPNGWTTFQRKRVENRQLRQEVQQLQQENEDLERHVKALKSDPKAIEREAREQLRYAKPGEVIYVQPEQRPAPGQQPPANAAAQNKP